MENTNGELFAVLRSNNEEVGGNTWAPIGGEIENGETKEDAIIREIKEECNLDVKKEDIEFLKTIEIEYEKFIVTFETFKMKIDENNFSIKLLKSEATQFMWARPEELYKRKDLLYGFYKVLEGIYNFS